MKSLCGADCAACQWNSTCPGCDHEKCFIARYIQKDGKDAYEEAPRHEKPELIMCKDNLAFVADRNVFVDAHSLSALKLATNPNFEFLTTICCGNTPL